MDKRIEIKIKNTPTEFAINFPKRCIMELQPLGMESFYADEEGNLYNLGSCTMITFSNKSDAEAVLNNVLNSEVELEDISKYSKICLAIMNNDKTYSRYYKFIHIYGDEPDRHVKEYKAAKELLSTSSILKLKKLPDILLERFLEEMGFGYKAGYQFLKSPSKINS